MVVVSEQLKKEGGFREGLLQLVVLVVAYASESELSGMYFSIDSFLNFIICF